MLYQSEEKEAQVCDRLYHIIENDFNEVSKIMSEFVLIPIEDIPKHRSTCKTGEYTTVYVENNNIVFEGVENGWRWLLRDLSAIRAIAENDFAESEIDRRRDELAKALLENSDAAFISASTALQKAINMIIEKEKK